MMRAFVSGRPSRHVTSRLVLALAAMCVAIAAHPAAGLAACAEPGGVREQQARRAGERLAGHRRGRLDDPGLRDVDERQQGRHDPLQDQDAVGELPHRHLPSGLLPGQRRAAAAAQLRPTATLPQTQPACLTDASTGLIDCGNWARVGVMDGAADAVSGVYIARLVRNDTARRAARSRSSCATTPATPPCLVRRRTPPGRPTTITAATASTRAPSPCPPGNPRAYKGAFKVTYNRPFNSAVDPGQRQLVPVLRRVLDDPIPRGQRLRRQLHQPASTPIAAAALLLNHKLFISSGHDEYWSGAQRANVEAARDAGRAVWRSSAATRCSGRPAGRAEHRRHVTRRAGPSWLTRTRTSTRATDPVAWTGTWADPRSPRPATAAGRRTR